MKLSDKVRKKVDRRCLVTGKLKKNGCEVVMAGMPRSKCVIDCDERAKLLKKEDETRCDYLLFVDCEDESRWVAVLELKRGNLDASEAVRQLRAGARATERLVSRNEAFSFCPVIFCKGMRKREKEELKKANAIQIHDKRGVVRVKSCGDKLSEVFS